MEVSKGMQRCGCYKAVFWLPYSENYSIKVQITVINKELTSQYFCNISVEKNSGKHLAGNKPYNHQFSIFIKITSAELDFRGKKSFSSPISL